MDNMEIIYKMFAVKGDIFHKVIRENWGDGYGGIVYKVQCSCKLLFYRDEFKEHLKLNPDLTTEAGAFWLLIRLDEWDGYADFTIWLNSKHICAMHDGAHTVMCTLRWIAENAKDGKAPALFNALCEFTGVEVAG